MTFTLTVAWWWIPFAITIVALAWAAFVHDDRPDTFGIGALMRFGLALIVSLLAWAIAGALK